MLMSGPAEIAEVAIWLARSFLPLRLWRIARGGAMAWQSFLMVLIWSVYGSLLLTVGFFRITWPVVVFALALLLVSRSVSFQPSWLANRDAASRWSLPSLVVRRGFVFLSVLPVLTIVAAMVLGQVWKDFSGPHRFLIPQEVAVNLAMVLTFLQIPMAVWTVIRFRPISPMEAAVTIVSLLWAYSCFGIAAMGLGGAAF